MMGSPAGPGGRGKGRAFGLFVIKANRRLKRRTAAKPTTAKASFVSMAVGGWEGGGGLRAARAGREEVWVCGCV